MANKRNFYFLFEDDDYSTQDDSLPTIFEKTKKILAHPNCDLVEEAICDAMDKKKWLFPGILGVSAFSPNPFRNTMNTMLSLFQFYRHNQEDFEDMKLDTALLLTDAENENVKFPRSNKDEGKKRFDKNMHLAAFDIDDVFYYIYSAIIQNKPLEAYERAKEVDNNFHKALAIFRRRQLTVEKPDYLPEPGAYLHGKTNEIREILFKELLENIKAKSVDVSGLVKKTFDYEERFSLGILGYINPLDSLERAKAIKEEMDTYKGILDRLADQTLYTQDFVKGIYSDYRLKIDLGTIHEKMEWVEGILDETINDINKLEDLARFSTCRG